MPSYIHRLKDFNETINFLKREDVSEHGKFRIRIDPNAGPLPDETGDKKGNPIPDMLVEAKKITQIDTEEPYYLITDLTTPALTSYMIAESLLLAKPIESSLNHNQTTDPYGSLNYDSKLERSIEHQEIRNILETEERLRGEIGIYEVEINENSKFPGINPPPMGLKQGTMVIKDNTPVFIVSNPMDNYSRPDMVSSHYLATEPMLIKTITPLKDTNEKIQKEKLAKQEAIDTRIKAREEENRKLEIKQTNAIINKRNLQIEAANYLNSKFGANLDIPPKITTKEEFKRIPFMQKTEEIYKKITEFKDKFNFDPELSLLSEKGKNETLNDLNNQIELELFKHTHGFYLKTSIGEENGVIEVYDKNDRRLSVNVFDVIKESKSVNFNNDDHFDFNESLSIINLSTDEPRKLIELTSEIEDSGKLDKMWEFLSKLEFCNESYEDLNLEYATVDGNEVHLGDELSSLFLMELIEKEPKTLKETIKSIKELEVKIEQNKKNNRDDDYDQALGF